MATTKPVHIGVIGMDITPELQALIDAGHTVEVLPVPEEVDMVMGPKCWRISQEHMKFLPLAIKEARAAQPKRVKKEKA